LCDNIILFIAECATWYYIFYHVVLNLQIKSLNKYAYHRVLSIVFLNTPELALYLETD